MANGEREMKGVPDLDGKERRKEEESRNSVGIRIRLTCTKMGSH